MNALFLSLRVLHVLLGAAWLGAAVLLSFFLMPAVQDVGPDGGKVVIALVGRRLDAYIASIAGLTVLSGLYLYWHFTDGFDPSISSTMGGQVFGAGGVLGLVSAIIGGRVVARNMKKAVALMTQSTGVADAAARSALMAQAMLYRQKAATGGRVVAFLLIVTIMLMALGHYV
jgi:hypothetical protein